MSASMLSQRIKARSLIFAGSAAGLAVTGALYGAGLKEEQQIKKKVQARQESTITDKIAMLEQTRLGLIAKKIALEKKISELEARNSTSDKQKSASVGQGKPI